MGEQYTEKLETLVPPSLHFKVITMARHTGLSKSAYLRRILTIWHEPDQATLDIPENRAILTEPVEYVTEEE